MELPIKTPAIISGDRKIPYTIETKNLTYTCEIPYDEFSWLFCSTPKTSPKKTIIKNVNLEAKPGEITAIAGPSGAGKTTLLEILAGKIPPRKFSGQVLANGNPINPRNIPRLSGYITQDHALFPLLTVQETLTYSALLRLPDGSRRATYQSVKKLMKELGLDHIASSRIGGGGGATGGISGGERRRLSVGVELVHDPTILLIDEPTSGLDSASALRIISLLKLMASDRHKTVILTVHQPGFRILELFDKLVLLSNGSVLHHGSLNSLRESLEDSGHRIPPRINVLEFAIETTNRGGDIQISETRNQNQDKGGNFSPIDHNNNNTTYTKNPQFREITILCERFGKNIFRTKELFAARVLQSIFVGIILGTVYMKISNDQSKIAQQTRLGFFAFSLSFLLSSTTEGLPIFLQERTIFMRETFAGAYRVSSYVAANAIVFFPFLLLVALLYSTPSYWLVGLRPDLGGFLYFTLVVWAVVLMSNSFTAFCGAVVPNYIMGTSVAAGLMGCFFLFSGYFIEKESIPDYWMFMHYLSLFKYPFESLVINEYGGGGCAVVGGDEFLKRQGLEKTKKWSNLGVMLGFVFGYRVLCFCVLWYRSSRTRN